MQDEQYPIESIKTLEYEASINRFIDEDGYIIHDLTQHFNTWELDQWKRNKDYDILFDKKGEIWELYYNDARDINAMIDLCGHTCFTCHSKCEMYELIRN